MSNLANLSALEDPPLGIRYPILPPPTLGQTNFLQPKLLAPNVNFLAIDEIDALDSDISEREPSKVVSTTPLQLQIKTKTPPNARVQKQAVLSPVSNSVAEYNISLEPVIEKTPTELNIAEAVSTSSQKSIPKMQAQYLASQHSNLTNLVPATQVQSNETFTKLGAVPETPNIQQTPDQSQAENLTDSAIAQPKTSIPQIQRDFLDSQRTNQIEQISQQISETPNIKKTTDRIQTDSLTDSAIAQPKTSFPQIQRDFLDSQQANISFPTQTLDTETFTKLGAVPETPNIQQISDHVQTESLTESAIAPSKTSIPQIQREFLESQQTNQIEQISQQISETPNIQQTSDEAQTETLTESAIAQPKTSIPQIQREFLESQQNNLTIPVAPTQTLDTETFTKLGAVPETPNIQKTSEQSQTETLTESAIAQPKTSIPEIQHEFLDSQQTTQIEQISQQISETPNIQQTSDEAQTETLTESAIAKTKTSIPEIQREFLESQQNNLTIPVAPTQTLDTETFTKLGAVPETPNIQKTSEQSQTETLTESAIAQPKTSIPEIQHEFLDSQQTTQIEQISQQISETPNIQQTLDQAKAENLTDSAIAQPKTSIPEIQREFLESQQNNLANPVAPTQTLDTETFTKLGAVPETPNIQQISDHVQTESLTESAIAQPKTSIPQIQREFLDSQQTNQIEQISQQISETPNIQQTSDEAQTETLTESAIAKTKTSIPEIQREFLESQQNNLTIPVAPTQTLDTETFTKLGAVPETPNIQKTSEQSQTETLTESAIAQPKTSIPEIQHEFLDSQQTTQIEQISQQISETPNIQQTLDQAKAENLTDSAIAQPKTSIPEIQREFLESQQNNLANPVAPTQTLDTETFTKLGAVPETPNIQQTSDHVQTESLTESAIAPSVTSIPQIQREFLESQQNNLTNPVTPTQTLDTETFTKLGAVPETPNIMQTSEQSQTETLTESAIAPSKTSIPQIQREFLESQQNNLTNPVAPTQTLDTETFNKLGAVPETPNIQQTTDQAQTETLTESAIAQPKTSIPQIQREFLDSQQTNQIEQISQQISETPNIQQTSDEAQTETLTESAIAQPKTSIPQIQREFLDSQQTNQIEQISQQISETPNIQQTSDEAQTETLTESAIAQPKTSIPQIQREFLESQQNNENNPVAQTQTLDTETFTKLGAVPENPNIQKTPDQAQIETLTESAIAQPKTSIPQIQREFLESQQNNENNPVAQTQTLDTETFTKLGAVPETPNIQQTSDEAQTETLTESAIAPSKTSIPQIQREFLESQQNNLTNPVTPTQTLDTETFTKLGAVPETPNIQQTSDEAQTETLTESAIAQPKTSIPQIQREFLDSQQTNQIEQISQQISETPNIQQTSDEAQTETLTESAIAQPKTSIPQIQREFLESQQNNLTNPVTPTQTLDTETFTKLGAVPETPNIQQTSDQSQTETLTESAIAQTS